MSSSQGQVILDMLKSDVLTSLGTPLLEFLTAVQKSPDPINQAAQFTKLTGSIIAALPSLELQVIQQITGILMVKLQSLMTQAQAAANLAKPVPASPTVPAA